MSDYDFDIDDILAEFYKDLETEAKDPEPRYENKSAANDFDAPVNDEPDRPEKAYYSEPEAVPEPEIAYEAPRQRREEQYDYSGRFEEIPQSRKKIPEDDYFEDDEEETEKRRPLYVMSKRESRASNVRYALINILGFIFGIVSLAVIAWVGVNVHPESETMTFSKSNARADLVAKLDNYSNNSKVDVLSSVSEIAEQAVIKKVYKIPENQTVAPKPQPMGFGTVDISNAHALDEIIAEAKLSGLLDDQNLLFNPDAEFYRSSDIEYYYDETILVICWKQLIENRVTSFVEVKIADGSQIRRKICEDTYGSSVYMYCSELAEQANAVVAMNSDYYAFRDLGITCYDRIVYRFNEFNYYGMYKAYNVTDTLFINPDGDFVVFKRGTEATKDEVQRWVNDNNLLYSIAFGPLMVENYELVDIPDYPVGEINEEYSRAGLAQVDKLHYLYMAVSHSPDGTPRCNVRQFAQMFKNMGVKTAYCFDGGQTGEVYFQGKPYNYIDWNNERTVSDIIYFASALSEETAQ